jgi:pyruvate formate lyase activating enzyme
LVKFDYNGLLPEMPEKYLPHLDYAAIDVKTSTELYPKLKAEIIDGQIKTIELLKRSAVNYEFRCTTVPGFVDEDTVPRIGEMVKGARRFAF